MSHRNIRAATCSLLALLSIDSSPGLAQQPAPPTAAPYEMVDGNLVVRSSPIQREQPGEAAPPIGGRTEVVSIDNRAFLLSAARWPNRNLFVCWENPSDADRDERDLVRRSVEESWERHSALVFSGWEACAAATQGIRIRIDDTGPHVKRLGKFINGMKDGMVLNFAYNHWSPSCKAMLDDCNRSIAVHEFGHAVGFAHEQNRPDTPGECTEAPQGTSGDVMLTPWDRDSVMNYCNPKYNNDGQLSPWDVVAVQRVYGAPE